MQHNLLTDQLIIKLKINKSLTEHKTLTNVWKVELNAIDYKDFRIVKWKDFIDSLVEGIEW
jgi:hypothetical protein